MSDDYKARLTQRERVTCYLVLFLIRMLQPIKFNHQLEDLLKPIVDELNAE